MGKTLRKSKTGKRYKDRDRKHQKTSRSCLHGGGCPYCEANRIYNNKVKDLHTKQELKELDE